MPNDNSQKSDTAQTNPSSHDPKNRKGRNGRASGHSNGHDESFSDTDGLNDLGSVHRDLGDDDTDTDWGTLRSEEPWPKIDAEAFHGLAGDVVDAIAPHAEADPVALLLHYLVMAGNIIGRKPYYSGRSDPALPGAQCVINRQDGPRAQRHRPQRDAPSV
jgi:hypothetical protein